MTTSLRELSALITKAREVATEYYCLTGRPLGITGEIGEYEAAHLLGLNLSPVREAGYDATDVAGRRLQIKTRRFATNRIDKGQRVGSIKLDHPWDAVLLVLMDQQFMPVSIWEAERAAIEVALLAPGSKARNERGALAVSKFKRIGRQVWPT